MQINDDDAPLETFEDLHDVIDELIALGLVSEQYHVNDDEFRFCLKPSGLALLAELVEESEVIV